MSVLSYQSIKRANIFTPFNERTKDELSGMTFGCGSASYDVRVAENVHLREGHFVLASTIEHFNMPNNVRGVVHDKSTLVRLGVTVQNTFIDPGWRGYLTLELLYHKSLDMQYTLFQQKYNEEISSRSVMIPHGTPIAQIELAWLDEPTEMPYDGEYQDQKPGPQQSKIVHNHNKE